MRKREAIQPRKLYRAEADVFLFTAGRKNQPQTRGWGDSVGVNRAWRAYKVVHVYLGGLTDSAVSGRSVARFCKPRANRRSVRSRITS